MRFNLISNIDNGYGLQRDYEIVKSLLESHGHEVNGIQFQRPGNVTNADVNIYLETVIDLHGYARENWLFPNPEWFELGRDGQHLPYIDRVLCKTADSYDAFKRITKAAQYVGFESMDMFRPKVHKERRFLHIAGKSIIKNTEAILGAWRLYQIQTPLTIISHRLYGPKINTDKIKIVNLIPNNEEFARIINQHRFHICPSQYEGWGHCLHEGMSTGAVIITTDAPPMNEPGFDQGRLIPVAFWEPLRMAILNKIDPEGVVEAVSSVLSTDETALEKESKLNRLKFLSEETEFRKVFMELVNNTARKLPRN